MIRFGGGDADGAGATTPYLANDASSGGGQKKRGIRAE